MSNTEHVFKVGQKFRVVNECPYFKEEAVSLNDVITIEGVLGEEGGWFTPDTGVRGFLNRADIDSGIIILLEDGEESPTTKLSKAIGDSDTPKAPDILQEALNALVERAASRDVGEERSMLSCVNAFNALHATEITEEQGWMFMAILKMARARGGEFRADDYTDGSAYFALAGEAAKKERS